MGYYDPMTGGVRWAGDAGSPEAKERVADTLVRCGFRVTEREARDLCDEMNGGHVTRE